MAKSDEQVTTARRLLAKSKGVAEIGIEACDHVLERIATDGVTQRDVADIETLRRGLEFVDDQIEDSKYPFGGGWSDAELERLAKRLRERIATLDALVAAAKPH